MKTLAFTCGDINGIGPEICIKAINQIYNPQKRKILLFIPKNVFENTAAVIKPSFQFTFQSEKYIPNSEYVTIIDIGKFKLHLGEPTKESGKAAFISLQKAFYTVTLNNADAMITAPISKTAFQLAGKNYPGQTELLAEWSRSKNYLMMFLSAKLICGLATIHEPLKKISGLITKRRIETSIQILYSTLQNDLGIEKPHTAVLGLNPHAGENGNIGQEEIKTIQPVIREFKNNLVEGPFVPDAFFGNKSYKKFDAVLGMYHDQVLIPFKLMNFSSGVNFTAGLPIVRTSPDHGTGYDIAGKGIADSQSIIQAVRWAERIISNRRKK